MKGVPLPDGLSWEIHFMFWIGLIVIGGLFALSIYFIKRYIDKTDQSTSELKTTLEKNSSQTKELTYRIEREASRIDQSAAQMIKSQADFQNTVTKELLEIHKGTVAIKNDLNEGKLQIGSIRKDLESMSKTIEAHQNSLSLGAKAMVKQREEVLSIQTTIKKLAEDVTLIGQKVTKKGG